MELYLFFAAALLLPLAGQLALLRLGRRRPRLRFARWLLLAIPAVFSFWPPRPTGAPASPPAFWPCFI